MKGKLHIVSDSRTSIVNTAAFSMINSAKFFKQNDVFTQTYNVTLPRAPTYEIPDKRKQCVFNNACVCYKTMT